MYIFELFFPSARRTNKFKINLEKFNSLYQKVRSSWYKNIFIFHSFLYKNLTLICAAELFIVVKEKDLV